MEDKIIKLLRENSIGKQTAVLTGDYGLYIWRKKLHVMFDFNDYEFSEMTIKQQEEMYDLVKNKDYEFSKSYQG